MSHVDQGPLPAYNSLTDNNLSGYFASTRMRSHLRRAGLITRRGQIVSENTYRLNMSRKEHKKHVKDMLAQAIVHKTLDLERSRQAEIRKKLEEIAKIELVRRVRASRDRKRENYVLPLVSPRRESSCQSSITSASSSRPMTRRRVTRPSGGSPSRKGRRPISALSSNYDDENETVVYLDDEGRPISPAHIDRTETKYSSKDPIDTRHLYSLDTAALRKYAMLMAKMEQGRGGLASPYLIPQVPLPPKSPRSGRAPQSANRQRSDSDLKRFTSPKRPATASQAYLHPAGPPKQVRGQMETMCEVFMEYHGSSLSLVREQFDKRQDIIVEQQHCGGNTLTVFRDKMEAGTKFSFISYRHRGYPFSLSIYIDGKIDCRVSVCCEHRHSKGGRIGGKKGHFSISSITGAIPCYKCQVEKGIRVKSAAPRRKLKRPPQTMEEVTVVETQDKEEVEEQTEQVEDRSGGEEILVPVDDDDDDRNGGQSKSEAADYDEDFDSETEEEGFLNFQPKDARGIDKTTGKVDINDPTDSSNIDDSSSSSSSDSDNEDERRAKTPTPHGRRKKMKKKKGAQRVRSGSSSASGSSSDTAKEKSDDEEKKKKENGNEKEEDEEEDKKQVMARFFCAKPVGQKNDSEDDEKSDDESKNKKENNDGNEKTKEKIQDYDETRQSVGGVKRVSMSSSSDSESDGEKAKAKGSSDDYSDSRKDENRVKTVTATPKIVDMGDEENAHAQDKLVMESQRPATATEVGAREEGVEVTKSEARRRDSQADDEEDNSKRDVQKVNYSAEQSAFYGKGFQDNDRDDASSTSSSPSSSSSSGSATLHDKGPNTVNDPTLTLDDRWREQSGDETKNNGGEEMEKEEEKEMEKKEQEEEQREKPRVQIIREDLNKKPESDSSSASSSSSSDDSDSDEEKKAGKKTTTWQAQADVHQSESQPESDPEATHGGNDPDNVANGSSDLNGSRTFEPAVPEKAKPGSVLPLLEASHSTLEIKGVTLNKSQVYEVAEFLEREHGINSVNLVNCGIDDDDVQKLMEVIQQSPSNPLMLNLGLNPLTVESVHHILMACKRKPTIEAVLLQGTRLGDDGVNALVTGMMAQMEDKKMRGESTEQCIHELDLSDCKFGDQGALGIARLLTSPLDIDTLTLTHNHAISSDGWKAIGDALKHNRNLETLTLDHNYIGDDGIEHITQGLFDNSCVTAIDINDVGISDKGGKSIMELLKRNTYLLEITVMENKLTDEMADNIQRYISLNKASYSPK